MEIYRKPNEAEWNDWGVAHYRDGNLAEITDADTNYYELADNYAWELRKMRFKVDHDIVFTHGDLNQTNILLGIDGPM